MKSFPWIIFIVLVNAGSVFDLCSQIFEQPRLKLYESLRQEEGDLQPFKEIFWKDGSLRVEFDVYNDSTATRREYFEIGGLRIVSKVRFGIATDTVVEFDTLTYKETIKVKRWASYLNNGNYAEYYRSNNKNIDSLRLRSNGLFEWGKRVGEWQIADYRTHGKILCNYDTRGKLSGPYTEYYYHRKTKTFTKKVVGEFARKKYQISRKRKSGEIYKSEIDEVRRVGKWSYYAEDGQLLQVVNYDWKLE